MQVTEHAVPWYAGLDENDPYVKALQLLVAPPVTHNTEHALKLLEEAWPLVERAVATLAPLEARREGLVMGLLQAGVDCSDPVYEAFMDHHPFGRACGLAWQIHDRLSKVVQPV
jgi:hypothetical protein